MSKFLSDIEIGCLVANWDESDDDIECSDDENEMFTYETENYESIDPDISLDINSLPVIFEDEGEYITIPNNENQPKLFNNEVLTLDICEPGPSSSNTDLDTCKNNKNEMTTCPNPSVIQSTRSKTLRPKFSRKPIESTLVQNRLLKKQKTEEFKNLKWKKGNLIYEPQLIAHDESLLPNKILEFSTPYQFFTYFFDEELFTKIKSESEVFAAQIDQ